VAARRELRWAILLVCTTTALGSAHGESEKRAQLNLPRRSNRGGIGLWLEGGVGAVVPVPAGIGGGARLVYESGSPVNVGAFAYCAGASSGPDHAAAAAAQVQQKKAFLCDAGVNAGLHGKGRGFLPALSLGLGWGFLELTDESAGSVRYRGRGAVLSARMGGRIGRRYEIMLRADVPLFRAVDPGAGTRYGMGLMGEIGIRLF
jgi:hypothetical protein